MKEYTHILKKNARIGIINRGEAARRFIRAVREYNSLQGTNFKTVALYIESEEKSPFVKMSDEVLLLSDLPGYPGKQKMPYLDHDLMIEALEYMSCDAVWVGWGFVSEDAVFAKKIEKMGLVFMGPSSRSMTILGDKIEAKALAEKAEVPILPWSRRAVKGQKDAEKISQEIGYPVIVKAANAGGGRGIRFVRKPEELEFQFKSAREETIRVTGNDIVFIEALVEKGRHLEVQVLADMHGNVNTFGVRDCSVQRKNQKIIEETPPAGFSKKIQKEMEAAAQRLIQASDYVGAGTVEFLYDLDRKAYYFMEVNTRLQVEHPITETLYGIDLVKGQIDVARGLKVDLTDRNPNGAVAEVRLNAEDPERDFSPAPGDVVLFHSPSGPGIRVDSGIEQGSTIPGDFDSMIVKIIAHAPTRAEAFVRLEQALRAMKINIKNGTTNRAFLIELLNNNEIKKGGVHTGFVEELLRTRKKEHHEEKIRIALLAGAIEQYISLFRTDYLNFKEQISRIGRPRNLAGAEGYEISLRTGGTQYKFRVRALWKDIYHIQIGESEIICNYQKDAQESLLIYENKRYNILMTSRADMWQCEVEGYPVLLERESGGTVKSPSPAIVLSVNTTMGKKVKKGDVLVILEAMKMEMLVQSPGDAVVSEIYVNNGTQVAAGQPLVLLDIQKVEKTESKDLSKRISFKMSPPSKDETWHILLRELHALFLGYDHGGSSGGSFKKLLAFIEQYPEFKAKLLKEVLKMLEAYTSVENLFTQREATTESFARPVSYQELLTHYFLRENDPEKGLPLKFLSDLVKATGFYHKKDADRKTRDLALYHIFQSHSRLKAKREVVKHMLFSLQGLKISADTHLSYSSILGRVVQLAQTDDPSTADAALYARYKTVDAITVAEIKAKQAKAIESLLKKITKDDRSDSDKNRFMNVLIDSAGDILDRLAQMALDVDKDQRELGLEVLGRRLNRDRQFMNGKLVGPRSLKAYYCESKQGDTDEIHYSLTSVVKENKLNSDLIVDLTRSIKHSNDLELTCIIRSDSPIDTKILKKISWKFDDRVREFTIGWLASSEPQFFRTWIRKGNKWEEHRLARGFSPLEYRELRIVRLKNFDHKILYKSPSVTLLESVAKSNAKEKRLFALASFSDPKPVKNKDKSIDRMIMFEEAFLDAVFAMRSVQAKYKFRLQWNRIILHNRSLQDLTLAQLTDYGRKILPHTHDLGLEKVVIYTRRVRGKERSIQEVELMVSNLTQEKFTMESRKPETKPLEPYNDYITKVVRARQRNMVYPYEFIKMITYAGVPLHEGFPRGEFEEYDVKIYANGKQRPVSVKGREYGKNTSNLVFGIICHPHPSHKIVLERVIILSDPTKDLGSLAEPECRSVIAALDLADKKKIPVEWIPISSGAKIDMETGTENLDWTATALQRIIHFTQKGGEINVIVPGVNVGAQSYWNAEATMLMHTRGLLIMTDDASMLLTGKRALDFSGSVSGETNLDIGGAEKIMGPNGQSQIRAKTLADAYQLLLEHYKFTYKAAREIWPPKTNTVDPKDRDITKEAYHDFLGQGFEKIGDIFSRNKNPERKKPFDIRQVMQALIDKEAGFFERWQRMKDADTAIVWETRLGGNAVGMIGIESRPLPRFGAIPHDGPETWSGGTLFPGSSKKIARGINAFSGRMPLVILANLSGFDGSPESLRKLQLEYGAEIGRAIVNFKGPIAFLVIARYHGGAYVVFSKSLNPNLRVGAIKGSYASVLGGAPAAAVIFPREVSKETYLDPRIASYKNFMGGKQGSQENYDELFRKVYNEKQTELGQKFDKVHSVERAKKIGSIDDIIDPSDIRPYLIRTIEKGMKRQL
jgi:acetyl/propionyl-CoA carboxylase alpha subunit/acetyl-CoA carboxylase carboxyltransferase component